MRVDGKTALVLGGAGLVGQAVCARLAEEGAGTILVGGLTEGEARRAVEALGPGAGEATLTPVWGNLFVRRELAFEPTSLLVESERHRGQLLADDLGELSEEVYEASHLAQLVRGKSDFAPGVVPHIVVDAVNTATALAYGGVYQRLARALEQRSAHDAATLEAELDQLLRSFTVPRLVRHVQVLSQAMLDAGTDVYVKVGTTGTGGMGVNIPYTHGEEKPSRLLLTKAALAGAHSMLLFLLARTPGGPAVREVKPAAAITWKRIAAGPVRRRGHPLRTYDCPPDAALELQSGDDFLLADAGVALDCDLESVFIDTGENGLFSIGEFTAITSLGQMEAVTPQEIANVVVREVKGRSTGRDVVSALDGAIMGPSYRAGVLRDHAIAEAKALAAERGLPSIAFEILGPPRLSKLLFEAELLRRGFGDLDGVATASPEAIAATWSERIAHADADVRRHAVSVGIPILMPDGSRLLAAARHERQHEWEEDGWRVDDATVERWTHAEWIDLRRENAGRWRRRAAGMVRERDAERADANRSSSLDRHFTGTFDIGEVVAWVFEHEDGGYRV